MRHLFILRSLITCSLAIILVVIVQQAVGAQWGPDVGSASSRPQVGPPVYNRFITITVDPGLELTPNLTSLYQSEWLSVPINLTATFPVPLPSDATNVSVTVANGVFTQTGDAFEVTLWPGLTSFGWQYRTAQNVTRQGRQYQISQRATDNLFPFQFQGIVSFSTSYQYVGTLEHSPTDQSAGQARWNLPSDYIPEIYTAPHRMLLTTWLADPRIPEKPDLNIISHSFQVDTQPQQSVVHFTALVGNSGNYTTGAPAYLNLYDRLSPSTVPAGPLDLEGGWCGTPERLTCQSTATFTNPLNVLEPGQVVTLAASYVFTQPGRHQFYLLVDAFGSDVGLNQEINESNNLVQLGEVVRPYKIFIPLVRK